MTLEDYYDKNTLINLLGESEIELLYIILFLP